jgi:DNA-binding transcriptional MerR regulator
MKKQCTTRDAAKAAGITRQSVHFWMRRSLIVPPPLTKTGRYHARLWSEAEITMLRAFKGTLQKRVRGKRGRYGRGRKKRNWKRLSITV